MKKNIYVLTYDIGHLKCQKVVNGLLKKKYKITVIAFPFIQKKRNLVYKKKFSDRPYPILKKINNETYYKKRNVNYIKAKDFSYSQIKKIKFKKNSVILHTFIKILPKHFVKNKIILNAHPGILPINRGLDSFKWGVLKRLPFGVILHKIDHKVDSGFLMAVRYIDIVKKDSLSDISKKSFSLEINLLINFEKYLKNLKKRIKVTSNYSISKKRISLEFEKHLPNIYNENKSLFKKLQRNKTYEIK